MGHRVEGLGEHAQLVAAGYRRLAREIAARHRLHRLRKRGERLGEEIRLRGGYGERDEKRHQQREGQRDDVDTLQALARNGQFAVVTIGHLDRFGVARE